MDKGIRNLKIMIKKILSIVIFSLLLVGCGFHLRSAQDFPSQIRLLNLQTPNPYSTFTTNLTALLKSMDVKLTKTAPYTLKISNVTFNNPQPSVATTTEAVTYTYSLMITYSIEKHGKAIFGPISLSASQGVIMNVNQIYSSNSTSLVHRELERNVITLLYNSLISDNAKKALNNSENLSKIR